MQLELSRLFEGKNDEQSKELTFCQVNQLPAISGYSYWLAVKGCCAIQYFSDENVEVLCETTDYVDLHSTARSIISRDKKGFRLTKQEFELLRKE